GGERVVEGDVAAEADRRPAGDVDVDHAAGLAAHGIDRADQAVGRAGCGADLTGGSGRGRNEMRGNGGGTNLEALYEDGRGQGFSSFTSMTAVAMSISRPAASCSSWYFRARPSRATGSWLSPSSV